MFKIRGSGYGKINALLNLVKIKDDDDYSVIDKIYFYFNGSNKIKHQHLVKKLEKNGRECVKDY